MENTYKSHLDDFFKMSSLYKEMLCRLVFNICMNNSIKKDYVNSICESRDSIIYRVDSINWHLKNMCRLRIKYENRLRLCKNEIGVTSDAISLYYMFDDIIFNLVSLYDYYSRFISIYFIANTNKKSTWNSIVKSAYGKQSEFSKCWIAKEIIVHNQNWASGLHNFRACIIHNNFDIGAQGVSWNAKQGCISESSLLLTVPKKLCKKLKFKSEQGGYENFDLNYGTFEVVTRSLCWINMMTNKINKSS